MRVLVVGGTGPTGLHVLDGLLDRGHAVTILHRGRHEPAGLPDVEHIHGDPHFRASIDDAVGARSFDVVIAMIASGNGGSIINNASVAGLVGGAGPTAYSAAKAAVVNFTANAAVELAAHRIRVNAVCPGVIDTPMVMSKGGDEIAKSRSTFQPWPDLGRPADVADLVLYLAGPGSTFVTGEAIRIDGGMMAWGPRMAGAHDPQGTTRRYAGFADGSTGRPATKRRIDG